MAVTVETNYLHIALEAARAAGRVIREGAQRPVDVRSKGLRDYLTDVDLAAESAILEVLGRRCPDHDTLTEETPPGVRTSPYCWVIDPLDGTGNFAHGYPVYSTSIGLTLEGEPVVGVVYDPMREHLFAATANGGATLNGVPLRASATEAMIEAFIGMDWSREPASRERTVKLIGHLSRRCNVLRTCGSAALALCYVAAGWWDAYWHVSISAWDVAAGALIAREAGGRVTDLAGQRWDLGTTSVLASNGRLHAQLCALVAQVSRSW
jgi:myo-inositol-1(or 4)-monophosphatase